MRKTRFIKSSILMMIIIIIFINLVLIKGNNAKAEDIDNEKKYVRNTVLETDINGDLQITRNNVSDKYMGKENSWTLFVYMCGSDLEKKYRAATRDIKEMIAASQCENVNVIIQTGGSDFWNKPCIDSDKIGRYIIKNNRMELVESHPDANMGDGRTLKNFLKWGIKKYPAEHMGVIIWNHGAGVVGGVCSDIKNNGDTISLIEMEKAFADVSEHMTDKFEFVGFDACLMSTIEVANILVPYAEYMIASEQPESSAGWEYKTLVNTVVYNIDISGKELGKSIIDAYREVATEANDRDATLAMLDLSKVDEVLTAFNKVGKNIDETCISGKEMLEFITSAWSSVAAGAGYWQYGMIDMRDYMEKISVFVNDTENVINALENMVVYESHGEAVSNAYGVTMYFPFIDFGMGNMNMLRNVVISPYYMNFIEKVLYYNKFRVEDLKRQGYIDQEGQNVEGMDINNYNASEYRFEDYKDNDWENSGYYFDKDYEFVEYNFDVIDEYLELRDFPYYMNTIFDDNWYELYI